MQREGGTQTGHDLIGRPVMPCFNERRVTGDILGISGFGTVLQSTYKAEGCPPFSIRLHLYYLICNATQLNSNSISRLTRHSSTHWRITNRTSHLSHLTPRTHHLLIHLPNKERPISPRTDTPIQVSIPNSAAYYLLHHSHTNQK